jgi:hypothetical protein
MADQTDAHENDDEDEDERKGDDNDAETSGRFVCPYCRSDMDVDGICAHVFCNDADLGIEVLAGAAQCADLADAIRDRSNENENVLPTYARPFLDQHEAEFRGLFEATTCFIHSYVSGNYEFIWTDKRDALESAIRKVMQRIYAETVRAYPLTD